MLNVRKRRAKKRKYTFSSRYELSGRLQNTSKINNKGYYYYKKHFRENATLEDMFDFE
jgi:hypothetical protein